MKSLIVIPARYQSSRFPGKPLVNLLGKPMILWVCELCSKAVGIESVIVATDDKRISKVVDGSGFNSLLTSPKHLTGTDRIAELSKTISADIYVNVQGDEPLVNPKDIISVIDEKKRNSNYVINCFAELSDNEDKNNINIPKVIVNENNELLYMSRLPIPGFKNITKNNIKYYKQVCIYAFSKSELKNFFNFGRKSTLAKFEDIEILRFFEFNKK